MTNSTISGVVRLPMLSQSSPACLTVDLNVVRFDLVDDQPDHLWCGAFTDAVAIIASMKVKMDAKECVGSFHTWWISGVYARVANKAGGNGTDYQLRKRQVVFIAHK
jgi:hypothetical protein